MQKLFDKGTILSYFCVNIWEITLDKSIITFLQLKYEIQLK